MRIPLVALLTLSALGAAGPAFSAPKGPQKGPEGPEPLRVPSPAKPAPTARVAPRVVPKASPTPSVPAPVAEQLKAVEQLASAQLRPAYAEAQLELAKRYQAHGQTRLALAAARVASQAFDRQVELHKSLSETLVPYERARAERATAHDLGVRRDRANFTIGELARELGDDDTAITHYVMVVQSQPDQPLGQDALAALVAMGVVAPFGPQKGPAGSEPSRAPLPAPSPSPKP